MSVPPRERKCARSYGNDCSWRHAVYSNPEDLSHTARDLSPEQCLRVAVDVLAFLLDRSYISYQRAHCGSGYSAEWPSYIGTGDHVADRCAARGEGKADEIDRVLRRVPAYLLKDIAGDDDATTFEALRASSGGAIVCLRPRPLPKRPGPVSASAVSCLPPGPFFFLLAAPPS